LNVTISFMRVGDDVGEIRITMIVVIAQVPALNVPDQLLLHVGADAVESRVDRDASKFRIHRR
jgi:hypothetical protein